MIGDTISNFLNAGISVIPIANRDKRPDFRLLPADDNNQKTWEPYKNRLPTQPEILSWTQAGLKNYGVVCGWQNLVVLDFDEMAEYINWLQWATKTGGIAQWVAAQAYRVSTSRGVHVYIRLPHKQKNRKVGKIDIKGDGYVLGPGSIHPSGAVYTPMRSVFEFPLVSALSDVLPSSLLTEPDAPVPAQVIWKPAPRTAAPGQGLIKKLRQSYPIEGFFPHAQKSGSHWLLANCPLHDDHSPSMWVDTERQICGCFAGCTPKPLDSINLFGRLHGLNNRDAIIEMSKGV